MDLLDWVALVVGTGLICSGVLAIRRRRVKVPEEHSGKGAVALGWVWIALGVLFLISVVFQIPWLKSFFKLFLEAAN